MEYIQPLQSRVEPPDNVATICQKTKIHQFWKHVQVDSTGFELLASIFHDAASPADSFKQPAGSTLRRWSMLRLDEAGEV